MHIEVWQGPATGQRWHWHFKQPNGRIVADAEAFPTQAHAVRAAKAVVRGIIKPWRVFFPNEWPNFTAKRSPDGKRLIIRWA